MIFLVCSPVTPGLLPSFHLASLVVSDVFCLLSDACAFRTSASLCTLVLLELAWSCLFALGPGYKGSVLCSNHCGLGPASACDPGTAVLRFSLLLNTGGWYQGPPGLLG